MGTGLEHWNGWSMIVAPLVQDTRHLVRRGGREGGRRTAVATLGLLLWAMLSACAGTEDQKLAVAERSAAEDLVSLGDRMRDAGDLDVAIAIYRQAVERDNQLVLPLLRLGSALVTKGDAAQASGAYEAALALEPENPYALRGLGRALIVLGEPQRAVEPLSRAIEVDGQDPRTLRLLGASYDLLGQHEKAQAAYADGLELLPRDVDLRSNLALSLALTGQYDSAIELMRAVANDPAATLKHRRNYALVLGLAGRELEAERFAQRIFGEGEIQALLKRTRNLRKISDTTLRARAIGTNELSGQNADPSSEALSRSGRPDPFDNQGSTDPRS